VKGAKKTFHTVQKGEWLSSIAPQYDVTTEELRDANVKSIEEGDLIYPGQQLLVPVAAQSGGMSVKGVLVKVVVALLVLAAASGIWPTIKESQEQQNKK
jgi:LysM repeat protein